MTFFDQLDKIGTAFHGKVSTIQRGLQVHGKFIVNLEGANAMSISCPHEESLDSPLFEYYKGVVTTDWPEDKTLFPDEWKFPLSGPLLSGRRPRLSL